MSWLTRIFHSFTRQKLQEQQTTPTYTNSPKLVAQIYTLFSEIEKRNAGIAGEGGYSTSDHNNQSLVYRAVSFAEYRVEEVLGTCPDDLLIKNIVKHINANQQQFKNNHFDPDGAGAGTLVDIVNALLDIQSKMLMSQ